MAQMDLIGIAAAGGGIDISARGFTPLDLIGIASAGKRKGARLIIRDANTVPQINRLGIAGASPGNVIFVF